MRFDSNIIGRIKQLNNCDYVEFFVSGRDNYFTVRIGYITKDEYVMWLDSDDYNIKY